MHPRRKLPNVWKFMVACMRTKGSIAVRFQGETFLGPTVTLNQAETPFGLQPIEAVMEQSTQEWIVYNMWVNRSHQWSVGTGQLVPYLLLGCASRWMYAIYFIITRKKTQQATIDNIKTRMHDAHLQCLKKTASGCSILCSTPRNQGIILYLMGTIWSCRCSQKKGIPTRQKKHGSTMTYPLAI